jgi:tRNA(His) 5'-end guanylyltransferase
MLARSLYSHKELEGKNNSELHELIFKKGSNWNDLEDGKKRGRVVLRGPLGWVCHGAGGHEFAYWSSVVNRSVDMGKTEVEHSDWMKNQKKYIGEMMEWMKKHEEFLSTLSPEDLAKEKQKIRC